MFVQRPGIPPSRVVGAKRGRVSGEVVVVAPKAGDRSAYEWAYSLDGGRTWMGVPATTKATVTVTGLVPGTHVLFRYRATTKGVCLDWSDPVAIFVV